MSAPPGRPCFPHMHLKHRLPPQLFADSVYELQTACTNEMDMWDAGDTAEWGSGLPVIQLQVLHPHVHAVAAPVVVGAEEEGGANSTSPSPPAAASSPTPPRSLTPAAAARLSNASVRLHPDCKPLLSRGGKGSLKFTLSPSPVILARNLASFGSSPLTVPFYLHISVPGPLGAKILPAISGPHQLYAAPTTKGGKGGSSGSSNLVSSSSAGERMNYIMGEHGVHHAFFVPLHIPRGPQAQLPSVYSLPPSLVSPPAFIRFKEILGVNLGGRIWDCGLLLFEYLREQVLPKDPDFFLGKKILEVGSGTGLVGIWLWAYVLLRNRQRLSLAEKQSGGKKPVFRPTTFLLTDQEEAMDNLRDNIATNLELLAGGQSHRVAEAVRIESSRLSWGDEADHANLAIQPTKEEPFDLLIASDVVFNPIYFTPLLESMKYVSGPHTKVLMAYRPRAADRRQDEVFFKALPKYGWTCRKEGKYQDVFMLTLERIKKEEEEGEEGKKEGEKQTERTEEGKGSNKDATASSPSSQSSASSSSSPAPSTSPSSSPASSPVPPEFTPAPSAASDDSSATAAAATPAESSSSSAVTPPLPSLSPATYMPSSSPSLSPPVAPDSDDPFSDLAALHFRDVASGAVQGEEDGVKQARFEGFNTGVKRGKEIAGEMGFYFGFLHLCMQMQQTKPEAYPPRIWARCQKLHSQLLQSPLYQSAFDPTQLEDGSFILQIRNGFKVLMAQMGVWPYFQQQVSEKQAMSF